MRSTILVRWIGCVGVLASCLNEVENAYNPGTSPAVVYQHGDSAYMMAITRYGWVYASGFSSYSTGKCLLVSFEYDPRENGDAETLGYYTVTLDEVSSVSQQTAESVSTDTGSLLTNEQPILYAVSPVDTLYCVRLEDYLFIPSICWTSEDRTLVWQLTYDPDPTPTVVDGKSIYSLYLRVMAEAEEDNEADEDTDSDEEEDTESDEDSEEETEEAEEAIAVLNAFDISGFIEKAQASQASGTDLYIRLHYINQINAEDSTQFAWGLTDPIQIE